MERSVRFVQVERSGMSGRGARAFRTIVGSTLRGMLLVATIRHPSLPPCGRRPRRVARNLVLRITATVCVIALQQFPDKMLLICYLCVIEMLLESMKMAVWVNITKTLREGMYENDNVNARKSSNLLVWMKLIQLTFFSIISWRKYVLYFYPAFLT